MSDTLQALNGAAGAVIGILMGGANQASRPTDGLID